MRLGAVIWREGDQYVSLCPQLGVASAGASPDDAVRMLHEAVDLYLEGLQAFDMTDEIDSILNSQLLVEPCFDVTIPWAS